MTPWKYTSAERRVVARTLDDGQAESCLATREDVQSWVAAGNTILEPDPPPPPTQDELDAEAARQYQKLVALRAMTPTQVDAWVEANVTTLAQARDAIKTLAIAVSILSRRI